MAWNLRARLYDICEASALRRGPEKRALFGRISGRTLLEAVGTGIDIKWLPSAKRITCLDISERMLRQAKRRRLGCTADLDFICADGERLCFADNSFDTVVTSCTMCSVPDPLRALWELRRVLRPGGRILMFEHVRSRDPLLGAALDVMTLWTRLGGTEMNRDTVANVLRAGFQITRIKSVYMDIILAIEGVNPPLNRVAERYSTLLGQDRKGG